MGDRPKPRGRSRGRGRVPSPPPPGEQSVRPPLPHQAQRPGTFQQQTSQAWHGAGTQTTTGQQMQLRPAQPLPQLVWQPSAQQLQQVRQPSAQQLQQVRQPSAQQLQQVQQRSAQQLQQVRQPSAQQLQQVPQPSAQQLQQVRQPSAQQLQQVRQPSAQPLQLRPAPQVRQPSGQPLQLRPAPQVPQPSGQPLQLRPAPQVRQPRAQRMELRPAPVPLQGAWATPIRLVRGTTPQPPSVSQPPPVEGEHAATPTWKRAPQMPTQPRQSMQAVAAAVRLPAAQPQQSEVIAAQQGTASRTEQGSALSSRAYCRGTELSHGASRTAAPSSSDSSLPTQMGAVSLEPSTSGNSGNGASAGRGHSRGGLFSREDARQMILRPHTNSKIGGLASNEFRNPGELKVQVNYFELKKGKDWRLYFYAVDYSPDQDDRRQRYKIMEPHLKHFGSHVFDGMNIFSLVRLPEEETVYTSQTDVHYTVRVKLTGELDSLDDQFMRFLNLILRRCQAAINLKLIGRHYFNTAEAIDMTSGVRMRVFPGYQTSIRQHEESLLLNVDVVHKFQQQTTVLELLAHPSMNRQTRDAKLIGQIVMATYNHLTYRIDNFNDDMNPMDTFNYRGEQVTYVDYYIKKHQIHIRDVKQPLIYSKPSARQVRSGITEIFLVPELLTLTGIPEETRRDYHLMKNFASYTKMGVDRRVAALRRFNQQLLSKDKVRQDLANWGLTLASNLVSFTAGTLKMEEIELAERPRQKRWDPAEWSSEIRARKMRVCIPLNNWVVLITGRSNESDIHAFTNMVCETGRSIGMKIAFPPLIKVSGMVQLEREIKRSQGCQMIMIVLDRLLMHKYGHLKKMMACQIGVLSQCVLSMNTNPKKGKCMSVATKIALQMNAKLGGEPWQISHSVRGAMVVGYDVYHDTLTSHKSYGAVVSSTNPYLTTYHGQVTEHSNKEELSNNFAVNIQNSVKRYHACNKKFPTTVIVYRDGVGEGQIEYVKQQEIPAIKGQLKKISEGIGLLFIVVCKRINTRIFADIKGQLVNPPPGTVVDKVITLPHCYDFFLVSQKVTEGTVSPTSYNVLEDFKTNLNVDHVQSFTYKLTHLYFNWQGTVQVPAPCLYAHKLAYMTGTGTHSQPSEKVAGKLWFI
ncbi:PAZ domain [Trinorchestia longiramus]|nr:PAZ domain [Trinorchestia longiramus]